MQQKSNPQLSSNMINNLSAAEDNEEQNKNKTCN